MKKGIFLLTLVLLTGLPVNEVNATTNTPKQQEEKTSTVREFGWGELMPEPDQKVVDRYRDGKMEMADVVEYLDKLGNTAVAKLDNAYGRMPGFLVPLNMDKDQKATELLLVPSAGACIHVPPPPPNQTVYIKFDKGIKVTEAGDKPYWVTGKLIVEKNTSEYTDTLYTFEVESIEEYLW